MTVVLAPPLLLVKEKLAKILPFARLNSYENKVLSANDISSIKRVLIRKFVMFHIVVVQQQRQRNKQRNVMHVQSCFFFLLIRPFDF